MIYLTQCSRDKSQNMAKAICTSLCFVLLFTQTTHSHESVTIGTCSIVLTRDEMQREIRAQVDQALAAAGSQNCSSTETTNSETIIEKLEEISHNLEVITTRLTNSCKQGMTDYYPATSCAEILDNMQNAPSGYYWLQSTNGCAVRVYCDMTLTCKGVDGGWMQVAKLDMTNSSHPVSYTHLTLPTNREV